MKHGTDASNTRIQTPDLEICSAVHCEGFYGMIKDEKI